MGRLEREELRVVLLDTKNHVLRVATVYQGNVNASLVRVGELFRDAVRLNAAGVILVHNHPRGDPTPSPDDLHLTAAALAAGPAARHPAAGPPRHRPRRVRRRCATAASPSIGRLAPQAGASVRPRLRSGHRFGPRTAGTAVTDGPAVETVDLAKRYGHVHALAGLTMRVERGEVFGFLGPNGAGKTTAVKLLLGLARPTGGGGTCPRRAARRPRRGDGSATSPSCSATSRG